MQKIGAEWLINKDFMPNLIKVQIVHANHFLKIVDFCLV